MLSADLKGVPELLQLVSIPMLILATSSGKPEIRRGWENQASCYSVRLALLANS